VAPSSSTFGTLPDKKNSEDSEKDTSTSTLLISLLIVLLESFSFFQAEKPLGFSLFSEISFGSLSPFVSSLDSFLLAENSRWL
jgi:hypothetical protein